MNNPRTPEEKRDYFECMRLFIGSANESDWEPPERKVPNREWFEENAESLRNSLGLVVKLDHNKGHRHE